MEGESDYFLSDTSYDSSAPLTPPGIEPYNDEHNYKPSNLLILSELSLREKEKYYTLLLNNNAKFRRHSDGRFVGNIRLFSPGVKKVEKKVAKRSPDRNSFSTIYLDRMEKLKASGFINVHVQQKKSSFVYNSNAYPRLTALIAYDGDVVKPKLRSLTWLMKVMDDMYDLRYFQEATDAMRDTNGEPHAHGIEPTMNINMLVFPIFVVTKLGTNLGMKKLVDQTCWDLLYSGDYYRQNNLEVEIFSRFLQVIGYIGVYRGV